MIDGKPWFVAADACRCVGLELSKGTHHHMRKLDGDERMVVTRESNPVFLTGFRGGSLTLVSRPGLFKLIQRSSKPEAKRFDRYVRHEVLPQIMDHGGYVMPDADLEAVSAALTISTSRTLWG